MFETLYVTLILLANEKKKKKNIDFIVRVKCWSDMVIL